MILFSQVREDPNIEKFVLDKLDGNLDVLLVGSGGCTTLSILEDKINKLDIIDQNYEQLNLIKLKLAVILTLKNKDDILDFFEGRLSNEQYDNILNILDLEDSVKDYWKKNINFIISGINNSGGFELIFKELVDSNMNFKEIFSKENLIKTFGNNAVNNSKDFALHFEKVFNYYKKNYLPEDNYFYYQVLNNCYHKTCLPSYFDNYENIQHNKNKINYICNDLSSYLSSCDSNSYDLIHTSNITDWMGFELLDKFLQNVYKNLKKEGYVVLRRLNGNYNLEEHVSEYFSIIRDIPLDKSHFYSEVVVAQKK
jgi:S-adenosylmethionine:diacylglycerol 3-amino-3-carboxypropyl transferase